MDRELGASPWCVVGCLHALHVPDTSHPPLAQRRRPGQGASPEASGGLLSHLAGDNIMVGGLSISAHERFRDLADR